MVVKKLAHFSVRTADMEASRRFYVDVLGFTERDDRPDFPFAGLARYAQIALELGVTLASRQ